MNPSILDEIAALVDVSERRKDTISAWSVGMHIQHLSLAMIGISKALLTVSSPMPPRQFSIPKFFVMTFGIIPRGKGKAPQVTIPERECSKEELRVSLAAAREGMTAALSVPFDRWFQHPLFGPLTRDETLRFVKIHNKHHLKIIREILSQ